MVSTAQPQDWPQFQTEVERLLGNPELFEEFVSRAASPAAAIMFRRVQSAYHQWVTSEPAEGSRAQMAGTVAPEAGAGADVGNCPDRQSPPAALSQRRRQRHVSSHLTGFNACTTNEDQREETSEKQTHRSLSLEDVAVLVENGALQGWDIVDAAGSIIREMNVQPPDLWSAVISQLYEKHSAKMAILEKQYLKQTASMPISRGCKTQAAELSAQLRRNCLTRAGFAIRSVPSLDSSSTSGQGRKKSVDSRRGHMAARMGVRQATARAEYFAAGVRVAEESKAERGTRSKAKSRAMSDGSVCSVRMSRKRTGHILCSWNDAEERTPGEPQKRPRTNKSALDSMYARLYTRMTMTQVSEQNFATTFSDKELRVLMKSNNMMINHHNPNSDSKVYSEKTKEQKIRELIALIDRGAIVVPDVVAPETQVATLRGQTGSIDASTNDNHLPNASSGARPERGQIAQSIEL